MGSTSLKRMFDEVVSNLASFMSKVHKLATEAGDYFMVIVLGQAPLLPSWHY